MFRCLAKRLLPAAPRFGAGDCSCKTHLFLPPRKVTYKKPLKK
ncbi:MAG: hypothetical protein AB1652_10015 [Bacillota bacterium]